MVGASLVVGLRPGVMDLLRQLLAPWPVPRGGKPTVTYRGVNLGGWLVLERWMTPGLFAGLQAKDEYSFCTELGPAAAERLAAHRASFITQADLEWIASHGLNAVRLPVPHWVYGGYDPYVACIDRVRWLMDAAARTGLGVLLDLHTAPGSQNGQDHSGHIGPLQWNTSANRKQTIEILERLVVDFGDHPALIGIELLNEPGQKLPLRSLQRFYEQAYACLDWHRQPGDAWGIVAHDSFRPSRLKLGRMQDMVVDMHLYQAFSKEDIALDMEGHIAKAAYSWPVLIRKLGKYVPVIVGEWSLGLDGRTFKSMTDTQLDKAMQRYAAAQLQGFADADGWFFWNYKTQGDDMAGWNYRTCVERGWLPMDYHD